MKVQIHQCETRAKFPMNIGSFFIKKFQKTNYCHYAMSYQVPGTDTRRYFDSTVSGVASYDKLTFLKKYKLVKTYNCDKPTVYFELCEFLSAHLGKKYGFKQILGLAGMIIGVLKSNPFGRGAKKIICNELVVLFLNRFYSANVIDSDSLDLNDTTKLIERVL